MILLLSRSQQDYSTEEVMQWIRFKGEQAVRINFEDLIQNANCYDSSLDAGDALMINGEEIPIADIRSIWMRRWIKYNGLIPTEDLNRLRDHLSVQSLCAVNYYLFTELQRFSSLLLDKWHDRYWLTSPRSHVHKVKVLKMAQQIGLSIPDYLVCTTKQELEPFIALHEEVITKPMYETSFYNSENDLYLYYTTKMGRKELDDLPDIFFPSFFQKYIAKEFEIRAFYLHGKFYSMAIFSQMNDFSKVDYRKGSENKFTRKVPYQLPEEMEEKLDRLMKKIGLLTGSADLIVTEDGEYCFLEVNPGGQYQMTSNPCNYQLSEKIADKLIEHDRRTNE